MPTPAISPAPPADFHTARVRRVGSFRELITAGFEHGINALCWERALDGDFHEVLAQLHPDPGINTLDDAQLLALPLSTAGRAAVDALLADQRLLRDLELDPSLNCINQYPCDEEPGPIPTDVFSFHADSAPIETDTWLCTYHGLPSEGLCNDSAIRRVDIPETRAALLNEFAGPDGPAFCEFLREHCYDLHYTPLAGARPYSFGIGNLWRIATEWPGSPVPPCIHRAPTTTTAMPPRLLLIA